MKYKTNVINYLINLSFFLYFAILIIERSISVIRTFFNGIDIFSNGFFGYVYILVFVSIVGWLVYLCLKCRDNIKYLFKLDGEIQFNNMITASGILLLSGMVHTEYTIPVIQFISYGILILGILLKVILNHKESNNKVLLWLSFAYLVSFSMAIPVMYYSFIKLHVLFHIIEGVASFVLVGVFTYLFLLIFNKENDLFKLWPICLVVLFDVPLLIIRWEEEINTFVLIFISLSVVLFLAGYIYSKVKAKKE